MTLAELRALVNEQAEDEALWFITENIAEAYLQQELRRLHAAVEALPQETQCRDERSGR